VPTSRLADRHSRNVSRRLVPSLVSDRPEGPLFRGGARARWIDLSPTVQRRKPRLSREDWIAAALDAIAQGGLGAVAVEPLAARLGVTKGSFYAHFSSRDEWIDAALQSWEHSHGQAELDRFAAIDDPTERLHAMLLAAVTFSQSGALSVHLGLLGELADERVAVVLARVNASRIRLLTRTYSQLGSRDSVPQTALGSPTRPTSAYSRWHAKPPNGS